MVEFSPILDIKYGQTEFLVLPQESSLDLCNEPQNDVSCQLVASNEGEKLWIITRSSAKIDPSIRHDVLTRVADLDDFSLTSLETKNNETIFGVTKDSNGKVWVQVNNNHPEDKIELNDFLNLVIKNTDHDVAALATQNFVAPQAPLSIIPLPEGTSQAPRNFIQNQQNPVQEPFLGIKSDPLSIGGAVAYFLIVGGLIYTLVRGSKPEKHETQIHKLPTEDKK